MRSGGVATRVRVVGDGGAAVIRLGFRDGKEQLGGLVRGSLAGAEPVALALLGRQEIGDKSEEAAAEPMVAGRPM